MTVTFVGSACKACPRDSGQGTASEKTQEVTGTQQAQRRAATDLTQGDNGRASRRDRRLQFEAIQAELVHCDSEQGFGRWRQVGGVLEGSGSTLDVWRIIRLRTTRAGGGAAGGTKL